MIFPFVLLVVSLVCYIDRQQKLAAQLDFPDDLSDWCPHTEFCGQNASTPKVNQENSALDRLRPCCEPCSCSNDCGLKRTCCRDRFDLYNLDETLGTECISLDTRKIPSNYDEHFHIIDKCPDKKDTCREIHINETIYGHYFPVYSHENGMIYYNKHCAECHNQTEIESFLPSMSCPFIAYDGVNEIFNAIDGIQSDCFLRFVKPFHVDISTQKCWPKTIRKCKETGLNDLDNKCSSFNATFTSGSYRYQNVYCFLCNHIKPFSMLEWESRYTMCPDYQHGKLLGESPFTVLFDQESVLLYQSVKEKKEDRLACFPSTNVSHKVCRPLFCPEGMFYVRGACTYLGQTWYVRDLELFVNLTLLDSSNKLTIQDLRQIPPHKLADPLKDFISRPAFQNWNVDLFYNLDPDEINIHVRFIMAKLFVKNQILRPGRFISHIDRAMKGIWTLTTTNYVLEFKADFIKYKMYNQMGDGTEYIPFSFEYENADEIVRTWSENAPSKFGVNSLIVTKLFLCVQIELSPGDFNISEKYPEIVFISATNKQLGNAEFQLVKGPHGLLKNIRVCVDDVLPESNNSQLGRISAIVMYLLLFTHLSTVMNCFKF